MTTIQVAGQPMRVSVRTPSASTNCGVVVMIHGPGLDAFIEKQVELLAAHGFIAASADLFHRQPDDGTDTMTKVSRLRDREIIEDVDALVAHMRELGAERLAVIGFCMGGRNTYLLAGARPALWTCAGVFYGGNIMKPWGDGPSPFARTGQIACPMIGFFGNDDTNPSPDDVTTIDAELSRLGKPHVFHRYDGAGHAFLNFTNPERHRPAQAADAWAKLVAFLDDQFATSNVAR
ncbi:MAG TPA: dienelactone hydrolase family protein [Kofleriaceae bacterium]|nr:dienelactone hydrolase family protein [Kofleriaceae bacterium]